jgi:hypothetical protein
MCKLQALIKQKFVDSKVLNYQSPDEIVSMGCAKQCALITNSKIKKTCKEDLMFKCLSNPISLKVISFYLLYFIRLVFNFFEIFQKNFKDWKQLRKYSNMQIIHAFASKEKFEL